MVEVREGRIERVISSSFISLADEASRVGVEARNIPMVKTGRNIPSGCLPQHLTPNLLTL